MENTAKHLDLLTRLLVPQTTAVLTMELQNGVVGPDALLPALHEAVTESGMLTIAGRVCAAARDVGIRIVHATAQDRTDRAGAAENCKIFALASKRRSHFGAGPVDIGTIGAQLVDELNLQPSDVVVPRLNGMAPFTGSGLDQILRNLHTSTIVLMGVSVNLGVFGAAMAAVDLGYQVIIVRDAVAGVPTAYTNDVLNYSLSMIATIVSSDELLNVWGSI